MSPSISRRTGAWAAYDWGTSAFPAVISTFVIAPYVAQGIAPDPVTGQVHWGWMQALVGLGVALMCFPLGALADATGRRRQMLAIFTLLGVLATAAIWHAEPHPDRLLYALVAIGIASLCVEVAGSFYNASLPDVTAAEGMARLSAYGWGLGYLGGLACLGVCFLLLILPDPGPFALDRDAAEHVRATALLVAAWMLAFCLPALVLVTDRPPGHARRPDPDWRWLGGVSALLRSLPARPGIVRLLAARVFYTDGLNTFSMFGAIYAASMFGMGFERILLFGIAMNLSAAAGCFALAAVEERIGSRRAIVLSLTGIVALGVPLLATDSEAWFWGLALTIAFLFGAPQAASRTLMVQLASPAERAASFGLFALSGRVTGFIGPAVVATVTAATDSQRFGIATTLVFMAIGAIILAAGGAGSGTPTAPRGPVPGWPFFRIQRGRRPAPDASATSQSRKAATEGGQRPGGSSSQ